MAKINFFNENCSYTVKDKRKIRSLIEHIIQKENKELININFILTDNESLLKINQDYLNHDTYTDTITFSYNENINDIFGDVYISIDMVKENSKRYKVKISEELVRIFIHGTLHLCGYHDKHSDDEKDDMLNRQEKYLSLYINKIH